jgi:dTDP-4-dehydrorhamnose reductase
MTITVTGADGMLGRAVTKEAQRRKLPHLASSRQWVDIGDPTRHAWHWLGFDRNREPGLVINCAGIVRPRQLPASEYIRVNSFGPHNLAEHCGRLVQVSTDCVFDGLTRHTYGESSPPSPGDLYGLSKLAGEVTYGPHLTVRCSFLGFSPKKLGLLDWFLGQPPVATVEGWTSSWSGWFVDDLAGRLIDLALDSSITGLAHLPGVATEKLHILEAVGSRLRPDIRIVPTHRGSNLSLFTERTDTLGILGEYSFEDMIENICAARSVV